MNADGYLGHKFDPKKSCASEIPSIEKKEAFSRAVSAYHAQRDQTFDRLTKIDVDSVNLAKARLRREFKIPGTDSAIDEGDVRRYYPAAIAVFLALLLGIRRATIRAAIAEQRPFAPPFWIAPFPYPSPMPLVNYVFLNAIGIALFASLAYLYVRFMLHNEVFQSTSVFTANVAAGIVASCFLVDAIANTASKLVKA